MMGLLIALVFVGCSSTSKDYQRELEEREHTDIQRDYKVIDASSPVRPGWVEDAEVWAAQNREDIQTTRYFSFETEPKVSRQMACELAKANARADIAAEISSFITRTLAQTTEGDGGVDTNTGEMGSLKTFMESTLVEKVTAMIHGSSVLKTYWEKRAYKEDLGAPKDYQAYTCAVYVSMKRDQLDKAVARASELVKEQVKTPELKQRVSEALEEASAEFTQMRKGQL